MTVTYRPAVAAERIAKDLIRKHHDHLADVHIEYVFRSETAKSKGKERWGVARKVSGLNAYLAGTDEGADVEDFFVLEFSEPIWALLGQRERVALVDHELAHCRVELKEGDDGDEVVLRIAGHDVEEFQAVIERHGLWRPDVRKFVEAAQAQLSLLDGGDE